MTEAHGRVLRVSVPRSGTGRVLVFKTCGKSVQASRDLAATRQPEEIVSEEEFLWKFLIVPACGDTSKRRRSDFYFYSTGDTLTLVITVVAGEMANFITSNNPRREHCAKFSVVTIFQYV